MLPRFLRTDRHITARTPPTSRDVMPRGHLSAFDREGASSIPAPVTAQDRAAGSYHTVAHDAADRAAVNIATAQIVRG